MQTGTKVTQHADCSFTLDQSHYATTIDPIFIDKNRRQNMAKPLSPKETS